MDTITALLIPSDTDAPARLVVLEPTHDTFVELVDDINTDTVFLADGIGAAKVAANGKTLLTHAPNPRATQVMERFLPGFAKRDRVEGTAVFVGLDGEGDLASVPAAVVEFASNLFSVDPQ